MQRVYGYQRIKPGDRFGRLVVSGEAYAKISGGMKRSVCPCACDCGARCEVKVYNLTSGKTRSCGCLNAELSAARKLRHGLSRTRIHNEWCSMRQRCSNPNDSSYGNYGGRGIAVCPEWNESFESFRDWALANGYKDDLTIERRDVDGSYSPENCCWIPLERQALNRRTSLRLTAFGETKPFEEWSKDPRCKVSRAVFYHRVQRNGEDAEIAMSRPSERGPKKPRYVTAFGETKTARQWADDPRCGIGYTGLLMRLDRGVPPEDAITRPVPKR